MTDYDIFSSSLKKRIKEVFPEIKILKHIYMQDVRNVFEIEIRGKICVLKVSEEDNEKEISALKLVEHFEFTPKLIDHKNRDNYHYIVMSKCEGVRLDLLWSELKYAQIEKIKENVRAIFYILKKNKYSINIEYVKRCFDESTVDSNYKDYIINGSLERYNIVVGELCHNDLNACNFLINNNLDVFIVDWEAGGIYPEHWEYFGCEYNRLIEPHWKQMLLDVINKPSFKDRAPYYFSNINNLSQKYINELDALKNKYENIIDLSWRDDKKKEICLPLCHLQESNAHSADLK